MSPAESAHAGSTSAGQRAKTALVKSLKWIGLTLLAIVIVLLIWGVGIEPRLLADRNAYEVELAGLPPAWEAKRVALLSDWQLGMWLDNDEMVGRLVNEIVEMDPAAALLAGDFIYHSSSEFGDEAAHTAAFAKRLTDAGIPTFAVLGNHDWGVRTGSSDSPHAERAATVAQVLEAVGVTVLQNDAVALRPGGDGGPPLYIVGIGSAIADNDRPERALASVPAGAPRIVMMHNPDTFPKIPAGAAPLAVAGHTHGGQVRVPGMPQWTWWSLVPAGPTHTDGWVEPSYGAAGNNLYITKGIGFSAVPVRVNCRPELTSFTLRGAE